MSPFLEVAVIGSRILILWHIIFFGARLRKKKMSERTAIIPNGENSLAKPRQIVTQDECVKIAKEVADGAFYKLPLLAHALVHHLCDDLPPNASVHDATQHIALKGVGVLQRLPVEADARDAVNSNHRVFVLGAALSGLGFAFRIACSASVLLFCYNRFSPRSFEKKGMFCATLAWIAVCAWKSTSTLSKIDTSLALMMLMYR